MYISNRNQDVYLNQMLNYFLTRSGSRLLPISWFSVIEIMMLIMLLGKKNNLVGQEINSKVDSLNDGCDWGSLLS